MPGKVEGFPKLEVCNFGSEALRPVLLCFFLALRRFTRARKGQTIPKIRGV